MEGTLIAHCGAEKIGRADLARLPVPETTGTFKPIPHHEVVNALIETLGFRRIGVVRDEYAASPDGMKMFGVLDLEAGFEGCCDLSRWLEADAAAEHERFGYKSRKGRRSRQTDPPAPSGRASFSDAQVWGCRS